MNHPWRWLRFPSVWEAISFSSLGTPTVAMSVSPLLRGRSPASERAAPRSCGCLKTKPNVEERPFSIPHSFYVHMAEIALYLPGFPHAMVSFQPFGSHPLRSSRSASFSFPRSLWDIPISLSFGLLSNSFVYRGTSFTGSPQWLPPVCWQLWLRSSSFSSPPLLSTPTLTVILWFTGYGCATPSHSELELIHLTGSRT